MKDLRAIHIIGAGLAGSEAALQLAHMGYQIKLYEMRKIKLSPAHKSDKAAELVCSNSFGSMTDYSAPGQLKWEAEKIGSFILKAAKKAYIPAGMALGVDREVFANLIEKQIADHPNIERIDQVIKDIHEVGRPCIIATGPLTEEKLATSIANHLDAKDFLYFFDAIAPIIDADTINPDIAWKASRWDKGSADYYNCPLNKDEYYNLINEIKSARKIEAKDFEKDTPYFESCMPIEEMARRGDETPRFGPMSPKGLDDPKTNRWPYAVVQLRQDNKEATAFNMVGFQTKMAYPEQKRIFRMIPGLEEADFLKLGSIHRNMYINSPKILNQDLSSKKDPLLFFAGQITGVEGYFDSTCIGLMVAHFVNDKLQDKTFNPPPRHSAFGSLLYAITKEEKDNFQPTNINFGLFPNLEAKDLDGKKKLPKKEKKDLQLKKAKAAFEAYL